MGNRAKTLETQKNAASVQPPQGEAAIDGIVHRFEMKVQKAVRRLIQSSPCLFDLAHVFPGALYVLAARIGPAPKRRKALALVNAGAPLRDVAKELALPFWLRRLPPEAFSGPLTGVPSSDVFARRIANHLPGPDADRAFWLSSVTFAARAADEYFALWLAQQKIFDERGEPERLFAVLAAYAWHSTNDTSVARRLITVPWRPEMAFDTAVCAAKSWLNRIRLVVQLGEGAMTDSWLVTGEAGGLSFVPLITSQEILVEAHAMQNCADQYADRLTRDRCRLFSVRRRGVRLATLEIGPHPREMGVLAITQLKARHNLPVSNDVWQAAYAWLGTQSELRRTVSQSNPDRPFDPVAWHAIFRPYLAKIRDPWWLPEQPSKEAFAELDAAMANLARRAGVTSWLFT